MHIYAIGGSCNCPEYTPLSSVEVATISEDGSLSLWQPVSSLNSVRNNLSAVIVGNFIYVLGGYSDQNQGMALQTVERARINDDGSLSPWEILEDNSIAGETRGPSLFSRGYLYALRAPFSEIHYAHVYADGTLGPWKGPIPTPGGNKNQIGAAVVGGQIYILGGLTFSDFALTVLTNVDMATVNYDITAPEITHFDINGGAEASTSTNIMLTVESSDVGSYVDQMSFSYDEMIWSDWQTSTEHVTWGLPVGDGPKIVFGRVRDKTGYISEVVSDTISLDTLAPPNFGVTTNDGALFTNQISVTLTIGAIPGTTMMQISNDGGFAGATWEPYNSRREWQITQFGNFVIPRVVYIRYQNANGSFSSTFQDDIILDLTPPFGSVLIEAPNDFDMVSAADGDDSVTLRLSANDDVSGVGGMQISNTPDFVGIEWQPFLTFMTWDLVNEVVYVRFRDNAGNISATYSADDATPAESSQILLPQVER